mmetsp:Transcript_45026/g.130016  ORF Transcript_45026/g.130016 Transcript_45026/m.130016 type:complete len:261 (+) Transcript_45026:369-1151(+)
MFRRAVAAKPDLKTARHAASRTTHAKQLEPVVRVVAFDSLRRNAFRDSYSAFRLTTSSSSNCVGAPSCGRKPPILIAADKVGRNELQPVQAARKSLCAIASSAEGLLPGSRCSSARIQFVTVPEIAGKPGALSNAGGGMPNLIPSFIIDGVKASGIHGHKPKNNTCAITPTAQTSTFAPYRTLCNISGAMNGGVPAIPCNSLSPQRPTREAKPKSHSLMRKGAERSAAGATRKLSGLTSRCATPALWQAAMPNNICRKIG